MMTDTSPPPTPSRGRSPAPEPAWRSLIERVTSLEIGVAAMIAAVMFVLVLIEPDILEAPFENERTILFTVGGTAIAALGFVVMLWFRVPAILRVIVLVVPFAIVNWWLLSPYFIDDVVDEQFSTSISAQLGSTDEPAPSSSADDGSAGALAADAPATADTAPSDSEVAAEPDGQEQPAAPAPVDEEPVDAPTGPVLLGAGQFVGLAGHDGTGDAGVFQNPDGTLVLRFENFDIDNGPDLEVYLVPGADQVDLAPGSIHLGALKGNIGDQNYELPPGTEIPAGTYTVLVWCEAFSVEFVGATVTI